MVKKIWRDMVLRLKNKIKVITNKGNWGLRRGKMEESDNKNISLGF